MIPLWIYLNDLYCITMFIEIDEFCMVYENGCWD